MYKNPKVAIVDYGMGNLHSVMNAFRSIKAVPIIATSPEMLADAHGIILPGVGAFPAGMANLRRLGFVEALGEEVMVRGKPLLGICLGMQLLASVGQEHSTCAGLGFVPGEVVRLLPKNMEPNLRIPHIGWNDLQIRNHDGLYSNMPDGENFYFIHSYVYVAERPPDVSAFCHYGVDFAASIEVDNISAVQFHPEKSHRSGIMLLENWLKKGSKC